VTLHAGLWLVISQNDGKRKPMNRRGRHAAMLHEQGSPRGRASRLRRIDGSPIASDFIAPFPDSFDARQSKIIAWDHRRARGGSRGIRRQYLIVALVIVGEGEVGGRHLVLLHPPAAHSAIGKISTFQNPPHPPRRSCRSRRLSRSARFDSSGDPQSSRSGQQRGGSGGSDRRRSSGMARARSASLTSLSCGRVVRRSRDSASRKGWSLRPERTYPSPRVPRVAARTNATKAGGELG